MKLVSQRDDKIVIELSNKEIERLDQIVRAYAERAKKVDADGVTFTNFLEKLERFNQEVEDGYSLTIDDYTNDLSQRDMFEEIKNQSQNDVRPKLIAFLQKWDERFIQNTREIDRPIIGDREDTKKGWWFYRIPQKLTSSLKSDAEKMGI